MKKEKKMQLLYLMMVNNLTRMEDELDQGKKEENFEAFHSAPGSNDHKVKLIVQD